MNAWNVLLRGNVNMVSVWIFVVPNVMWIRIVTGIRKVSCVSVRSVQNATVRSFRDRAVPIIHVQPVRMA